MQSTVLDYRIDDAVCTITLQRPDSLNSFNSQLRRELLDALNQATLDNAVRVIVLKGSGKGFCAGADLSEGVSDGVADQLVNEYKPCLMAIHECPKPVIAQVHGAAAGIGASFALTCDMVVMSEDAYMYLAFAAIGLIPDGGLNWHLYHTLGPRKAYEIIVEGKKIPSADCLAYGMCNAIVPSGELDEFVKHKAHKLAEGAPLAQAAVKELLRNMGSNSFSDAINVEAELQQPLSETEDCRNAIAAFFRKEKPVFRGE